MTSRRRAVLALAGALAFVALGHADAPPGRYTFSNGTVYDTRTRLTWQQSIDAASSYTWPDATQYCASLPLAGGGWRLPSAKELPSIIDDARFGPGIDPTAFPGTPVANFWTSTTRGPSMAWFISFDQGDTSPAVTTSLFRVRCVR